MSKEVNASPIGVCLLLAVWMYVFEYAVLVAVSTLLLAWAIVALLGYKVITALTSSES